MKQQQHQQQHERQAPKNKNAAASSSSSSSSPSSSSTTTSSSSSSSSASAQKDTHQTTALQRHCEFFDRDGDGMISMRDTFTGCMSIGLGILVSAVSVLVINGLGAWFTSDSWWPTTTVHLKNIHRMMHGSDSGVYERNSGRLNHQRLDKLFQGNDAPDAAFTLRSFARHLVRDRLMLDIVGLIASCMEWLPLFFLNWRHYGTLSISRKTIEQMFDGSLFPELEKHWASKKQQQQQQKGKKDKTK
ncbi:hypothetical protein CAOG_007136 [Capsaspora owczarzaki ATCC 30864]|uniref:EF-hand domain-containing protein n=2 Tax=Capsaspora owczarzaki (strain ATCC 30864) TaxID=595528 RepID=A0A0D2X4Y8_CAPO3|nr:hypothetical protein CAOG_007136 [Capsaspora owczarzaki ATCC 30864]